MKFTSTQLISLINESEEKKLVLPNFQRAYVWPLEKQKTLVSTLLLDLPIGSFLILNGKSDDFAAREVCFPSAIMPEPSCAYLLDGQQRFSTLKNTFTDLYSQVKPNDWRQIWDPLFKQLRYRFYIKISGSDTDYFGYEKLQFNKEVFSTIEPSNLYDYIEVKNILAKDSGRFFHPAYNPLDSAGNELSLSKRRAEIIDGFVGEELIPLYELIPNNITSNLTLHSRVLNSLAINRQNKLRDELGSNSGEIIKLLEHVDSSIDDYIANDDLDGINRAWIALATNWAKDVQQFLESRMKNEMAQIVLEREEIARAFAIFEVINEPGTPLDEYDLVVAKAARNTSQANLTERVLKKLKTSFELSEALCDGLKKPCPSAINLASIGLIEDKGPSKDVKTRFLQVLSLISHCITGGEDLSINHLKREKFLSLTSNQINENYEKALIGVIRAYTVFHMRLGISNISQIPYKLMLIPVAKVLLDDDNWNSKDVINKIEYWYWSSLFSGHYKMNQNTRAFEDIENLENFVISGSSIFENRENKVLEDEEYSDKSTLCLESEIVVPKAIDQGILQYVLSNQPKDFIKTNNILLNTWDIAEKIKIDFKNNGSLEELSIEDHHICPLNDKSTLNESTSALRSDPTERLNSPLNRTYISKYSNRLIGPFSPNVYFEHVTEAAKYGHCIPMPINTKYKKLAHESNEDYYLRIVHERFEILKVKLREELLVLKS